MVFWIRPHFAAFWSLVQLPLQNSSVFAGSSYWLRSDWVTSSCLTACCHHKQQRLSLAFSEPRHASLTLVLALELTWPRKSHFSSGSSQKAISANKGRERRSFFFFSFLFSPHCWASKINLLLKRSDKWQTKRKAGPRRQDWGKNDCCFAWLHTSDRFLSSCKADF